MKRVLKAFSIFTIVMLAMALMPASSVLAALNPLGPLTSAVAVTPNPAPLNSTATVTAAVDNTAIGSIVASAEFSLNDGPWLAMAAADGAFDSLTEAVTASFKAVQAGANQVCVHADDLLGNTGPDVCASFTVNYVFKGFQSPIKMGVTNKANAPQSIPVKWWLTDANGKPVSSKSSFTAIMSYKVDCTTLVGDPTTAIAGTSPGKSGLKYDGNGKWHINWKTEKSFRGTCRKMFIAFNSVQNSPEVVFAFK
jgi:hypothetical protein